MRNSRIAAVRVRAFAERSRRARAIAPDVTSSSRIALRGARGYLAKAGAPIVRMDAVRTVTADDILLSPNLRGWWPARHRAARSLQCNRCRKPRVRDRAPAGTATRSGASPKCCASTSRQWRITSGDRAEAVPRVRRRAAARGQTQWSLSGCRRPPACCITFSASPRPTAAIRRRSRRPWCWCPYRPRRPRSIVHTRHKASCRQA
jgi:hypothetical protein